MAHLRVAALLGCVLLAAGHLRQDPGHYCRLSRDHQLCDRKSPSVEACGRVLVRGARGLQQLILDLHNVIRSKTAEGRVEGVDGSLPPAADMRQLRWDDELAEIAQAHVEKCVFRHDCGHCKTTDQFDYVGQNLGAAYLFSTAELGRKVKFLVAEWYKEVRQYSRREVKRFRGTNSGHFTQIIWGETEAIGCGVLVRELIKDGGTKIRMDLFCNYGIGGNVGEVPVYTPGTPCSRCSPGRRCSSVFPGLCDRA